MIVMHNGAHEAAKACCAAPSTPNHDTFFQICSQSSPLQDLMTTGYIVTVIQIHVIHPLVSIKCP